MKKNVIYLLLSALTFGACSQKVVSVHHDIESTLDTGSKLQKFHSVVYYPQEISLDFPGYIVGVEKSPKKSVAKKVQSRFDMTHLSKGIKRDIDRIKREPKILYISHIIKDNGCGKENRFIYNLYEKDKANIPDAYEKSFEALESLKENIQKDIFYPKRFS